MIEFEESSVTKNPTFIAKEKEINLTHSESQQMFRRLVERGRTGVFMADVKGYLFYVNHAFVAMLGYEIKDDILGANLADVLFKDREKRADFLKKLNNIGSVQDYELKLVRKDGIDVSLSITSHFHENDNNAVIGMEGIVHNVTEKSQLEEAVSTEKQKLEQILEFDETISLMKELDKLVKYVVERTAKILEAQKCSLMMLDNKTNTLSIVGAWGLNEETIKETKMVLSDPIAGVVAKEGQPVLVKNIEYDRTFRRANKPSYTGRSFMIVPIKLGNRLAGVINVSDKIMKEGWDKGTKLNYEEAFNDGDLRILCAIAREVSIALENIEIFKELDTLAVTDPLVNIYNYRQFSKSLDYEVKRCRRSDIPLCVIMIDIDDFKAYNDTFGHLEGDDLLRNLGRIFKEQLREVDIVCRYAGDEFAIILPDTHAEGARRAAQKVQEGVARYTFKKEVTLSFGIAECKGSCAQNELVLKADKALYRAKEAGKDRVCVFE